MFGFGGEKKRDPDKDARETAAQPRVFHITDKGRLVLYLSHQGDKSLVTLCEISVLLRARSGAIYAELAAAANDPRTMTEEEQVQLADELLGGPDPSDDDWASKYVDTPHQKRAHEIIRKLVHNALIEG